MVRCKRKQKEKEIKRHWVKVPRNIEAEFWNNQKKILERKLRIASIQKHFDTLRTYKMAPNDELALVSIMKKTIKMKKNVIRLTLTHTGEVPSVDYELTKFLKAKK